MNIRMVVGNISLLVVLLLAFSACAPANKAVVAEKDGKEIDMGRGDLLLVDYLRRVPGLQVTEISGRVSVVVRGISSISGDNSPLYIINGSRIGTSYIDAEGLVDVRDIESVVVLNSSEGMARYGMTAANGAIIITTER